MVRENLTTDGTEFARPDGTPYSGPYHVHIDKGAMVGARHISSPHDILVPLTAEAAEKVISIQLSLKNEEFVATAPRAAVSSSRGGGGGGGYSSGGSSGGGSSAPSSSY
tara:strand:- start:464 stop:790 length:327 start_codon:yes stop_codon:yes gene_type:complete